MRVFGRDFACPWCWIGKRQLDEAIRANADQYDVSIKWLPYQLFPHQSFHTKEHDGAFGAETIEVDEAMTSAAQTVGINLSPTYSRTTNTLLCHVLMVCSRSQAHILSLLPKEHR